jgi:hypothetical protein
MAANGISAKLPVSPAAKGSPEAHAFTFPPYNCVINAVIYTQSTCRTFGSFLPHRGWGWQPRAIWFNSPVQFEIHEAIGIRDRFPTSANIHYSPSGLSDGFT